MEKKEKLFAAICKALNLYEKDGITITAIHSHPEITSHLPIDKDDSYMEEWEEVTVNLLVKGRTANKENDAYNESNYRIENAKFNLTYNLNDKSFKAEVNMILSISIF